MITSIKTRERVASRHLSRDRYGTEIRGTPERGYRIFCCEDVKGLAESGGVVQVVKKRKVLAEIVVDIFGCRHTKRIREWQKQVKLYQKVQAMPKERRSAAVAEQHEEFRYKFEQACLRNGWFGSREFIG